MSAVLLLLLLIMKISSSASAGQRNLQAEPGQNVTLPCRAAGDRAVLAVEWSRADLESDYVFLYRDERMVPSYQHPSFRNRAVLLDRRMRNGVVSLVLKSVTTGNSGVYECRVFQERNKIRKRANLESDPISVIVLDVAPPPDRGRSGLWNRLYTSQTNRTGSVGHPAALSLSLVAFLLLRVW